MTIPLSPSPKVLYGITSRPGLCPPMLHRETITVAGQQTESHGHFLWLSASQLALHITISYLPVKNFLLTGEVFDKN
jgi:hypothetical protein